MQAAPLDRKRKFRSAFQTLEVVANAMREAVPPAATVVRNVLRLQVQILVVVQQLTPHPVVPELAHLLLSACSTLPASALAAAAFSSCRTPALSLVGVLLILACLRISPQQTPAIGLRCYLWGVFF